MRTSSRAPVRPGRASSFAEARRAASRARASARWEAWEKAKLDELLEPGESRTAFILRFTLSHPEEDTNIVGTMNPEHLAENVQAAEAGPLPPDIYAEATRRLDAAGVRPATG